MNKCLNLNFRQRKASGTRQRKDIKPLHHRVEKDSKNFGRLFVHFRWK